MALREKIRRLSSKINKHIVGGNLYNTKLSKKQRFQKLIAATYVVLNLFICFMRLVKLLLC